jgi:hypothetical protein
MRLETLEDALAWVHALAQGGATAVDNAELGQVLRLLWQTMQATIATQATTAAPLATLRALLEEQRDEDFRAAYAHGYHTGFAEAWAAHWQEP